MSLHDEGYVVLRGVVAAEATAARDVLMALARVRAVPIINFGDDHDDEPSRKRRRHAKDDRRRRQVPLPEQCAVATELKQAVTAALAAAAVVSGEHRAADWVVIHSRAGCQRQAAHADYEPSDAMSAAPAARMPLGVLVALMPDTRFHAWPRSIGLIQRGAAATPPPPLVRHELVLAPGDVLVFRGDLIHAGAEYASENVRVHAFLDSPAVPRDGGYTYIVSRCGDAALQAAVRAR